MTLKLIILSLLIIKPRGYVEAREHARALTADLEGGPKTAQAAEYNIRNLRAAGLIKRVGKWTYVTEKGSAYLKAHTAAIRTAETALQILEKGTP